MTNNRQSASSAPHARLARIVGTAALACTLLSAHVHAQMLETETARLLPARGWELGATFEYQWASDSTETAIPFQVLYGLTDSLEVQVEPVPFTQISPKQGSNATGLGDTEVTMTYLLTGKSESWCAFAVAAEVKLPTADNNQIGTGETDWTAYAIASKAIGNWDFHANLSYTLAGQPSGQTLPDFVGFNIAAVYRPNKEYEFFGEFLGNAASSGEGADTGAPGAGTTTEGASNEKVVSIGFGKNFSNSVLWYTALSEDNNSATQIRTGFTIRL